LVTIGFHPLFTMLRAPELADNPGLTRSRSKRK
jgi:hypothetical protein